MVVEQSRASLIYSSHAQGRGLKSGPCCYFFMRHWKRLNKNINSLIFGGRGSSPIEAMGELPLPMDIRSAFEGKMEAAILQIEKF